MTSDDKKPFWKSFYFPLIILVAIEITILVLVIVYTPESKQPGALRLQAKNAKCVYIGNVEGTSMKAYKLTVDTVDYILVQSYQGIAITKTN